MKKLISVAFSFLFAAWLGAQNCRLDLGLAHNWNFLDRDISLTATRYWGANGLRAGLHYFQHTAQATPAWDRYRAETFGQRIGFSLAYERAVRLPQGDLELYPYVMAQYFRLTEVRQDENFGQTRGLAEPQMKMGLGVLGKVRLHRQLLLQGGADLGPVLSRDRRFTNHPWFFGGLAGNFTLGAAWRFSKN